MIEDESFECGNFLNKNKLIEVSALIVKIDFH